MLFIFLNERPDYIFIDEELDYGPNYSLIHLSVYTYQVICATHGIIPYGPNLCRICEEIDNINNGIIKRQTCGNKKHLTKMSFYIGEFNTVRYQPMLKKYEYHRMLIFLLGKHECKNIRREAFLAEKNAVVKERDCAESLKEEFDIEIQSEEFGFNRNLSI